MKTKQAKEYIEECKNEDGSYSLTQLADLVIWAYDRGWSEGIEDYREELCSTEEIEFIRSR